MKTFSVLLTVCKGNSPVTDGFPSEKPVTRSFDVFLCAPQQTVKQTDESLVIWDAIMLIRKSLPRIPMDHSSTTSSEIVEKHRNIY